MTDHYPTAPREADGLAAAAADTTPAPAPDAVLDTAALLADLLDRAVHAQFALMRARARADRRAIDEALLQMRAACLLLASIPAPDPDARRFAVLAAALLDAEDDDASSYARRMVEHAVDLGDPGAFWVIDTPASGPTSHD